LRGAHVAAWLAYFVWHRIALNYGELIEARPSRPGLRRLDGSAFRLSQLRGRWVLLQIDSGACAEAAGKNSLHAPVRLAQARTRSESSECGSSPMGAPPDAALLRDTKAARRAAAARSLRNSRRRSPYYHIYLLDPLGT